MLVICILGTEYPKRIWTKFESDQFKKRIGTGEVAPIILKAAPLSLFDPNSKVGYINWDEGGDLAAQVAATTELLLKKCHELRQQRLKKIEERPLPQQET